MTTREVRRRTFAMYGLPRNREILRASRRPRDFAVFDAGRTAIIGRAGGQDSDEQRASERLVTIPVGVVP